MKIVHIYSCNLSIFEDAIKGTGCCINGSKNAQYLRKSIANYNVRDVLGLVVFQQHITKRTLKLMKYFDEYFIFLPKPIVMICDEATALYEAKRVKVTNSPLYLIDSMDGTISDVDVRRIFTTLICESGDMYNLRDVEQAHGLTGSSKRDISQMGVVDNEQSKRDAIVQSTNDILKQLRSLGV